MYEVYGIYEVGADKVLYIGSTQSPLVWRFKQHLYAAKPSLRKSLFDRHKSGELVLEIRPISAFDTRSAMLEEERALIIAFAPPYNANGVSRVKCKVKKTEVADRLMARRAEKERTIRRCAAIVSRLRAAGFPQYVRWFCEVKPEWSDPAITAKLRRLSTTGFSMRESELLDECEALLDIHLIRNAA